MCEHQPAAFVSMTAFDLAELKLWTADGHLCSPGSLFSAQRASRKKKQEEEHLTVLSSFLVASRDITLH